LILHAVGEYELSLRFLEKALALNIRYYGAKSLKVAVSFHLVARTQSCMGDFRSALNSEKETYAIYKQQVKHTGVYPEVSGLATWSENCKWYSFLPLGAVVSLFCES
jgi:hypothetical protein